MNLKKDWETLHLKKHSLLSRCEEYSDVSLPYVFPRDTQGDRELQSQLNSVGARAVNFLTNKLVLTLFPENQPFFRLQVSSDVLSTMTDAAKQGDEQAALALAEVDVSLAAKEREAVQRLGYTRFRTEATQATKLLIITGNACMYHPENENAPKVYSLRDYCVQRDLSGTLLKIITRDRKGFNTFSDAVQKRLQAGKKRQYKPDDFVTVYTAVVLEEDKKYHLYQTVEDISLDSVGTWTKDELPWKVLCWNLVSGEDYGHGLIEDYYGSFHALRILTEALVKGVAVAAEIKFLVNPASMLDVRALNDSASGTYHSGNEGDVTCVQLNKAMDFQMVVNAIDRLERHIATAFLMNSAVTRDAERVTAEEIRYVAMELETSYAGVYSRLAYEWQYPTAVMLLKWVGTKVTKDSKIQPMIITGIDALSRAGDLDNFRAFVSDLSLLNAVPEELRAAIDPQKIAAYLGVRRGVDYMKFLKSEARMQQEQEMEARRQQQLMASQAQADIAVEASKQSMRT